MPTVSRPRHLSTAEERREAVLEAALPIFAEKGYHGTPTAEVAKAAGISHAYLFRLFPTKRDLFLAVCDRIFARLRTSFSDAASAARGRGEDGAGILHAMGMAYVELLDDPAFLLGFLNAQAASASEPAVRDAVRKCFATLYEQARRETGASPDDIRSFMAMGMLCNVLAAIGAEDVDEPWALALTTHPESATAP
ncbi:MAG TPA: TetR/AcrR family transcriptional regulator [Solirubrobacteraceae bacterium]